MSFGSNYKDNNLKQRQHRVQTYCTDTSGESTSPYTSSPLARQKVSRRDMLWPIIQQKRNQSLYSQLGKNHLHFTTINSSANRVDNYNPHSLQRQSQLKELLYPLRVRGHWLQSQG
jgi:hypothetical protein